MQVKDRLSGCLVAIHCHAIACSIYPFVLRDITGSNEQGTDIGSMLLIDIVYCRNMPPWDNKYMSWCLWIDIAKGHHLVVAVNNVRADVSADDFAKQAI